jgi:hypothetical protein
MNVPIKCRVSGRNILLFGNGAIFEKLSSGLDIT